MTVTPEQIQQFCRKYIPEVPRFHIRVVGKSFFEDLEALIADNGFWDNSEQHPDTYVRQDNVGTSTLFHGDIFEKYNFEKGQYYSAHSFSLLQLDSEGVEEFYAKRRELSDLAKQDAELRRELIHLKKDKKQYDTQTDWDYCIGAFAGFVLSGFLNDFLFDYSSLTQKSCSLTIVFAGAGIGAVMGHQIGKRISKKLLNIGSAEQKQADIQAQRTHLQEQYEQKYAKFKEKYEVFTSYDKQAITIAAETRKNPTEIQVL